MQRYTLPAKITCLSNAAYGSGSTRTSSVSAWERILQNAQQNKALLLLQFKDLFRMLLYRSLLPLVELFMDPGILPYSAHEGIAGLHLVSISRAEEMVKEMRCRACC